MRAGDVVREGVGGVRMSMDKGRLRTEVFQERSVDIGKGGKYVECVDWSVLGLQHSYEG